MHYDRRTIERAERAVRCAPFLMPLFTSMMWQSVELRAIAGFPGVKNGYIPRPLAELMVENELLWLIQVGVLRREVDGQGLTDSFRLTPLGRHLVDQWHQGKPLRRASLLDWFYNLLNRWMRLPDWLQ